MRQMGSLSSEGVARQLTRPLRAAPSKDQLPRFPNDGDLLTRNGVKYPVFSNLENDWLGDRDSHKTDSGNSSDD